MSQEYVKLEDLYRLTVKDLTVVSRTSQLPPLILKRQILEAVYFRFQKRNWMEKRVCDLLSPEKEKYFSGNFMQCSKENVLLAQNIPLQHSSADVCA